MKKSINRDSIIVSGNITLLKNFRLEITRVIIWPSFHTLKLYQKQKKMYVHKSSIADKLCTMIITLCKICALGREPITLKNGYQQPFVEEKIEYYFL